MTYIFFHVRDTIILLGTQAIALWSQNRGTSLQYRLKSFRYMGAKIRNDLPEELKSSPSKYLFKKHLKKNILSSLLFWETYARK